jgi:flagellar assembly factor FliW
MDKKLGEQIIIDKEEYKIKHPLIERWFRCWLLQEKKGKLYL